MTNSFSFQEDRAKIKRRDDRIKKAKAAMTLQLSTIKTTRQSSESWLPATAPSCVIVAACIVSKWHPWQNSLQMKTQQLNNVTRMNR